MRKKEWLVAVCSIVLACCGSVAQIHTSGVSGTITKNGEAEANLQVVIVNPARGKEYKNKTDKKGHYVIAGVIPDSYVLKILGDKGEVLYVNERSVQLGTTDILPLDIDLSKPEASGGRAGTAADSQAPKKMSKDEQKAEEARVKAQNEKIGVLNGFITQYQTAIKDQNFKDAETALKHIVETVPDTSRWEFFKALGDVQEQNEEFADAIQSYDKGIQRAQMVAAGTAPKDPLNPNPDPGSAKTGVGSMLTSEGNAYVKLGKPEMATPLFQQATLENPSAALAFYNLCATEYNAQKLDEAVSACDRSIAADAKRADAWFLKGSALQKSGKGDSKSVSEAMGKYLELEPNGQHAAEARSILQTADAQK